MHKMSYNNHGLKLQTETLNWQKHLSWPQLLQFLNYNIHFH